MYYKSSLVYPSILIAIAICSFSGCSNSSTVINSSSEITFSKTSGYAHLEAGGLTILSPGDTLVDFDLVPDISITNTTDSAMHLYCVWNFDSITNGKIYPISPNSDTLDLGDVPSNGTRTIDSIMQVAWPQSVANSKLEYQLNVFWPVSPNNATGFGWLTPFDSLPFNNRYRGIIFTTESSPTPIAIIDGPDIGDWAGDSDFMAIEAFPNPALQETEIGFTIPNSLDSVQGNLYITPHHILRSISSIQPKAGAHTLQLSLSGISPGLYRLIWTAYKNGILTTCHGNIMVALN